MSAIRVRTITGDIEVDALQIVKGLAVHVAVGVRTLDGTTIYSITHLASGFKATPFYFPDPEKAREAMAVFLALPVDWMAEKPCGPEINEVVGSVVHGISWLFEGQLVEDVSTMPVEGSA